MFLSKFNALRPVFSAEKLSTKMSQIAGLKTYENPPKKLNIEWPEKNKLQIVLKVPQYPSHQRPFKMQKRLRLMRGPELIHTELIHKQFGIIAKLGGRMKHEHFEVIRMTLLRRCNFDKMFAVWRVEPPWQPCTKKGIGQRMGGGKGPINHYVTPVKSGRVILEVGGNIEYFEVERVLNNLANKMPFPAIATTYEKLMEDRELEKKLETENVHPYTWKYIIQNNMGGCHNWISPFDKIWFNKHL